MCQKMEIGAENKALLINVIYVKNKIQDEHPSQPCVDGWTLPQKFDKGILYWKD